MTNYNQTQVTDYEEIRPVLGSTIGLISAEKNAIERFREEHPDNKDEDKYLILQRKLSVK